MNKLDENIKDHYTHKYCPKHIVTKLLKKYPCPQGDCTLKFKIRAVLILLIISFLGYTSTTYIQAQCAITEMITVQAQHIPMTLYPKAISTLKQDLPKLRFLPETLPKNLDASYAIIGARYCKIKGQPTASVQVVERKTGQISTLYISPKRRSSFYPMASHVKNHAVKYWSEDSLSFTLIDLG